MLPIIEIEGLSKKYRLGALHQPYLTLRDNLKTITRVFQSKKTEEFYALRDISLKTMPGESIGIIGKNGAGKSTLLKIMSRITPPSTGRIVLRGRIASLLEVGTGFHGELNGRENIYFNGSLLGMKKREVSKKLDEIISFAGIERFIDTPLKHYSSGMQVRLAFSVAAHLEAEILLFDEVLAVGDAEFQKRSLGKMNEVINSGRTVFLVSHNMAAISSFCKNSVLLASGEIKCTGNTESVLREYQQMNEIITISTQKSVGVYALSDHPNKKYEKYFGMVESRIFSDGKLTNTIYSGSDFKIEIDINNKENCNNLLFGFVIKDENGIAIIGLNNNHIGVRFNNDVFKKKTMVVTVPKFPIFSNGRYCIDLYWGTNGVCYDIIYEAIWFNVEYTDVYQTGQVPDYKLNKVYISNIKMELHE